MSDELPQGWATVPLDQLCKRLRGVSYARDEASVEPKKATLPILRANNIENDRLVFEDLVYVPSNRISDAQRIRKGDVVIAMSSGSKSVVGKTAQAAADWDGAFGAFCGVLRPSLELNSRYLGLFLRTRDYRRCISELAAGTNINNLKAEHFAEIEVPLAPLAEQRRIVAKLETLLGKVDACQQRLAKIPVLLKRFRQSILTAACSGRLTADWREENPDARPCPVAAVDSEEEFPEKWRATKLGSLTTLVTSGSRGWAKYYSESGATFIRAQNINSDFLDLEDIAFVRPPVSAEGSRTRVQQHDILVTITGANVTKSALVEKPIEDAYVSQHVALVRLKDIRLSKFVFESVIGPAHGRKQLLAAAYGQGKPGLNLDNIRDVVIGLPPLAEQQEIVRRVDALFTLADEIEARFQKAKAQVDKLTPSLLARAFAGKLVPQDPADEPASHLLARLRLSTHPNPQSK